MTKANFISQSDAHELLGLNDVSFVDASWYLPAQGRDGHAEYLKMRIPGAVFFDIDKIADPETELPHMLPSPEIFEQHASVLGISSDHLIVVYDGPGLFSAPRVWWTFKVMGASDVRILSEGFDSWKSNDLPIETGNPNPPLARIYHADFRPEEVVSRQEVIQAQNNPKTVILDARPNPRFRGAAAEPRPGLRSGHIPGSKSLPFDQVMNGNQLKSPEELDQLFSAMGIGKDRPVVTSCGSGVTAAVLALALNETGRENVRLYDGSWADWGLPDGPEIETDDS
ncbi:MAG: 3-mercaptopyruvate sulfurtransferase [Rhizobiaceae bacterium]